MKRFIPFLFLVLPMALFAQSPRDQESTMLKKFGLSDPQITQVLDIQGKTEATVQQDSAQLRLLRAQMDKALLPASPDTPVCAKQNSFCKDKESASLQKQPDSARYAIPLTPTLSPGVPGERGQKRERCRMKSFTALPAGVPAERLRPLTGWGCCRERYRGYRYAQPPANCFEPSGFKNEAHYSRQ